jgi:hypothetical protein
MQVVFFFSLLASLDVPLPYCLICSCGRTRLTLMNSWLILRQQQMAMQVASYTYSSKGISLPTHTHTTDHPWPARGSSSAWYENANCFLLESLTHQSLAHSVFCDRVGTQRRSRHRGRQGGRIRAGEERTLFRLATTPAFRSWAVRPLEAHRRTGLYELSFPFCFFNFIRWHIVRHAQRFNLLALVHL